MGIQLKKKAFPKLKKKAFPVIVVVSDLKNYEFFVFGSCWMNKMMVMRGKESGNDDDEMKKMKMV